MQRDERVTCSAVNKKEAINSALYNEAVPMLIDGEFLTLGQMVTAGN